jgi:hypothetical protein
MERRLEVMPSPREKRKLADALADAGVGSRRVAIELLYLLPDSFVAAYEQLFHETFSLGDEGKGQANERQADLGRAKGSGAGSGSGSRKGSVFPVKNEKKLDQKAWVDRKLREIARKISSGEVEDEGRYKCGQRTSQARRSAGGCGKWNEKNWIYCPYCGHQNRLKIVNEGPGVGQGTEKAPADSSTPKTQT